MTQSRKNDTRDAGDSAKDAVNETAETGREMARETTNKMADTAEDMTNRGKEAARKGSEMVANGATEMMSQTRQMAEDGAEVGKQVARDGAELSRDWLAFWTEQTADGFRTMLKLTVCHNWKEAIDIQTGFMRTSIERLTSFTSQNAERATKMAANDMHLAEQKGRANVERLNRRAS